MLLVTNEDDPFSSIKGTAKADMTRMTIQRAKVSDAIFQLIGLFLQGQSGYLVKCLLCRTLKMLVFQLNSFR